MNDEMKGIWKAADVGTVADTQCRIRIEVSVKIFTLI